MEKILAQMLVQMYNVYGPENVKTPLAHTMKIGRKKYGVVVTDLNEMITAFINGSLDYQKAGKKMFFKPLEKTIKILYIESTKEYVLY